MGLITKHKVLDGVYWVEIPDIDLRMLCGCPADSIKHLTAGGFTRSVEMEGVTVEQGPNAILLSDIPIQNGEFANLTEFPLFHMFFTQGMIIPNHPNSKSPKPLVAGRKPQVTAQLDYVTIGNYGLITEAEYRTVGESEDFARTNLRMKRRFASGRFSHTRELVRPVFLDSDEATDLADDLKIRRLKENHFQLTFRGESVEVDLNLTPSESYKPSFKLSKTSIPKSFFSVTHTGEGDGWNPEKPSVSSVIQHDGKYYLIDAGPYISQIIQSVGLEKEQIEGIFITHIHDDHFGGLFELSNLSRSAKKVKLYATAVVQATVIGKLAALLSLTNDQARELFDFVELKRENWNIINGLEVQPIPTAHPVDTTLILFRGTKGNESRVFGHYCDIAALSWLKTMITDSDDSDGISRRYYDEIKRIFNLELDIKKIDVGGPTIHGDAADFANDGSAKRILCHSHTPFTEKQLAIAEEVEFGQTDILIR